MKTFISSIMLLSLTIEGAEFKDLQFYYSIPRQTIHEYREVDGKTYDIGKRKTFETIKQKADPRTRQLIKNAPQPMPKWEYIGRYKVLDKFDSGILIGQRAANFVSSKSVNSGISGTWRRKKVFINRPERMEAFILNHPRYSIIAVGDTVKCWALRTEKTKSTNHGPVTIYDYGKHVDSPQKKDAKGNPINKH